MGVGEALRLSLGVGCWEGMDGEDALGGDGKESNVMDTHWHVFVIQNQAQKAITVIG